jgi:hypothetical protein
MCCVAAWTIQYALNSVSWQHVRMFAIKLPWPSVAVANTSVHVLDGFLIALVGGVLTTLVVRTVRISVVAAAVTLSAGLFIANWLSAFGFAMSDAENLEMIVVFFVFGSALAWLSLKISQRRSQSESRR